MIWLRVEISLTEMYPGAVKRKQINGIKYENIELLYTKNIYIETDIALQVLTPK